MATCEINYTLADSEAIVTKYNENIEANFEAHLDLRLAEVFTSEELVTLANLKKDLIEASKIIPSQVEEVEQEMLSGTATQIESVIKSPVLAKASAQAVATTQAVSQAHEVFNADYSLSHPEPRFSEPKFTKPVGIQAVNYSLEEDYPHSYGSIDEVGNWWKVNKKKSHIEFVHNSGSFIHIDRDGNMTQHITGSRKDVILGDYSLEAMGGMDTLVHESQYLHVDKDKITLVDGKVKCTYNKSYDITVGGVANVTYSSDYNLTVGGNEDFSIGGSSNRISSGIVSISGAVVCLG